MSRTFWLGVFIVGALLILASGVFLIGDKEFLFSPTFPLKAAFENVGGLSVGTDVRVGGIRAGTVQHLELPDGPDNKVIVVMKLHKSARNLIRRDSVASIKTAGLLGDEYIEISFGSKQAPQLQNDDTIHSVMPVDMTELTSSVAAQTKSTLAAVQDDMEALKQNFLLRGFFDKRGYDDAHELTRHAIARLPAGTPVQEFTYSSRDLFDKADNAKLGNERLLKDAGSFLEQHKFSLAVVAVSEVLGDSEKQQVLTQARRLPSGDQRGDSSKPLLGMSTLMSVPSLLTELICSLPSVPCNTSWT
jgi:phospholipid/cholesterol/gamma-HCH transport system substrate-binding protein